MNVAVVMGGYSGEAEISLKSGQLILSYLDKSKYQIFEVHILNDGWYLLQDGEKYPINRADFSAQVGAQPVKFDVILNTIHGTPGEDGQLQAYWKLLGIPYNGCDFYQSALTFNKRDTLSVLSKFGIDKAESVYLSKGQSIDKMAIIEQLKLPLFVKANRSGSSIGVSMVNSVEEFDQALDVAFSVDNQLLVESYLKGREISVGVMTYQGEVIVVGYTEIISENAFFDYEAKYLGKSKEITPAQIDAVLQSKIDATAKKIYQSLELTGITRIDFIVVDGVPHFIEVNTNPGLSPQSIFPQQAKSKGLDFSKLLDSEIQLALNRDCHD